MSRSMSVLWIIRQYGCTVQQIASRGHERFLSLSLSVKPCMDIVFLPCGLINSESLETHKYSKNFDGCEKLLTA